MGDASKLFRFYLEARFLPAAVSPDEVLQCVKSCSGNVKCENNCGQGQPQLELRPTPMKVRDGSGNLLLTSMLTLHKESSGGFPTTYAVVDGTGKFTATVGAVMIAATSNPISNTALTVDQFTFQGIFQKDGDFCGGLSGQVTAPIMQSFGAPSMNVCLFKSGKAEDPLPDLQASAFMCPGL
jgi:hypothetical protein